MRRGILATALAVTVMTVLRIGVVADAAAADRASRRSSELSLPDPYLDPSWPDTAGEELEGRYGPGKSDSVEEIPFDEELEMQEELRARQEITGETPPSGVAAPAPAVDRPGTSAAAAPEPDDGVEKAPAPQQSEPYVPREDADEDLDLEERDPVEW